MKVLHTSDWHLGKKLEGRDRLNEQEKVLSEIFDIIENNQVELIICSGDIFDSFIPAADAEQLFFKYAKKFSSGGRALFLISGNHDDAKRLEACLPLAEELNIYIAGSQDLSFKTDNDNNVKLTSCGKGYAIFENKIGEKVFINALPFPSEYRFKEENTDEDYLTQMQRWLQIGHLNNMGKLPEILVTHIFTLGGIVSESERDISLGSARAFPPALLPECDYVALGHLHKFQKVKDNAYYSGSIMQYSFDEAGSDKYVITFDIGKSGIENFEKHKLDSIKKLVRLSANNLDDAHKIVGEYSDCFIELTLYLNGPLSILERKSLIAKNPDILQIIPIVSTLNIEKTTRKNLNKREMFIAYHKYKYNAEPEKELLELYLSLMEESDETC